MVDLYERFRSFDAVSPPDVWSEVQRRVDRDTATATAPVVAPRIFRPGARIGMLPMFIVLGGLLLITVFGGLLLAGAFDDERPPLPATTLVASPVSNASEPLPGNGRIAVSANPMNVGGGEAGDIYMLDDGGAPDRVIGSDNDGVAQACPRFSPDGRRLAYGEARASGDVANQNGWWPVADRAIVVVPVDEDGNLGAPMVRVPVDPRAGPMLCPEWSPDGSQLAFRVVIAEGVPNPTVPFQPGSELWIVDSYSGAAVTTPVTPLLGHWDQSELEWSRDGAVIAISEPGQIRLLRPDGSDSSRISTRGSPFSVGWTADDESIVYLSELEIYTAGAEVRRINVDGSDDTLVRGHSDDKLEYGDAFLSPDRNRVALMVTRLCHVEDTETRSPDPRCSGQGDLNPGFIVVDLSNLHTSETWIPEYWPVLAGWSPDGQRLLFSSIDGVFSRARDLTGASEVASTGPLNLEWSREELSWQPTFP